MSNQKSKKPQYSSSSPETSSHHESEEQFILMPAPPKKQETLPSQIDAQMHISQGASIKQCKRGKINRRKNKAPIQVPIDGGASEEETIIKKQSKIKGAAPPENPGDLTNSSKDQSEKAEQDEKAAPGMPGVIKSKRLYVGNLSQQVTQKLLRKHLKKFGALKNVNLVMNSTTGKSKGYAFVEFLTQNSASKAKQQMSEYILYNRQIRIQFCDMNE